MGARLILEEHSAQPQDPDGPSEFALELGIQDLWVGAPGGMQEVIRGEHAFKQNSFVFQTKGSFGYAIQGTGQGNVGVVTGYGTANGAVPLTGANELTVIALIEFTDVSTGGPFPIIRKDNDANSGQAQFALHYQFSSAGAAKIKPLVATSGTTGWVGGTETSVTGTTEVGVLYMAVSRWSAVRNVWDVALTKVGSGKFDPQTVAVSTPTGTISTTSGSESAFSTHFGGDAYTPDYTSTTKIYGGAVSRQFITDSALRAIAANPWQLFDDDVLPVFVAAAAGSYTLSASQGSYSMNGQSAGLLASRQIAATQGSYAHTGNDAALVFTRVLAASQGAYSHTGNDAGLTVSRVLSAAMGSYSLTGNDAALLFNRLLSAAQGTYTLTGQASGLIYTPAGSYALTADAGSYSLAGQAAGLALSRLLSASAGVYTLTGQDATLTKSANFALLASAGSYSLTGQDASFLRAYALQAAAGDYSLHGYAAVLTYSGQVVPQPLASIPASRIARAGVPSMRPAQTSTSRRR